MARSRNGLPDVPKNAKRRASNTQKNKQINKNAAPSPQHEIVRKSSKNSIDIKSSVLLQEPPKLKPQDTHKLANTKSIDQKPNPIPKPTPPQNLRPKTSCDPTKLALAKECLVGLEKLISTYEDVLMDDEIRLPNLMEYF